ncbi:MAG: hypothetical protein GY811_19885 [Myxococcales bacterium]|nr:hypothetical protein [Myxococcales bacterium]
MGLHRERWTAATNNALDEADRLRRDLETLLAIENVESNIQVKAGLVRIGVDVEKTNKHALSDYCTDPVVEKLQRYRTISRYAGNTGKNILRAADIYPDERLRPELAPLATSTGRFACRKPNLQQVPKASDFRSCIVPSDGNVFIVADYAAIELRVAAKVIGDRGLTAIFSEGRDPHVATAAVVLGKTPEEVTKEERSRAKPVNFGFMFGMGPSRFVGYAAADYGINFSDAEAQAVRESFLRAYPGVGRWHKRVGAKMAREVRTLSGRTRRFPNRTQGYSERLNMPIQGSAADGMKRAIALLHNRLKDTESQMVLTIHDELVVEVPKNSAQQVMTIVEEAMKQGMAFYIDPIPVEIDVSIRSSWAEDDVFQSTQQ